MQELTLTQVNAFFENELGGLMQKLTPDIKPLWGRMTPQHMVEHLAWAIEGAMEEWEAVVVTPAEKLPKTRMFLRTNFAIRPHFPHPNMPPDGELPPLRTGSLDLAIQAFWQRWADFNQFMADNPGKQTNHVVFGPLDADEWRLMQYKHVVHHLTQFGLTTNEEQGLELPPARPA